MRILIAAIAIVLLPACAHAQEMGGKGKRHQQDAQRKEQRAKTKVDEKAYEDALKSVPTSSQKADPWKSMR